MESLSPVKLGQCFAERKATHVAVVDAKVVVNQIHDGKGLESPALSRIDASCSSNFRPWSLQLANLLYLM